MPEPIRARLCAVCNGWKFPAELSGEQRQYSYTTRITQRVITGKAPVCLECVKKPEAEHEK